MADPGVIVKDKDLKAMNVIAKAMKDLEGQDRDVVISWFQSKYLPQFMTASPDESDPK